MGKPNTTTTVYRRLPGKKRHFFGHERLWQGPDHLMLVRSQGFYEDYKRFYFRDIQALMIRKTPQGRIFNIICGILICLCLLPTMFLDNEVAMFFWIAAALFLLLLVINVLFGPTCACHIRTAVQTEKLTALYRLRRARKVINRLKPLILAAQAGLAPLPAATRSMGQSSHGVPPPRAAADGAPLQKKVTATAHMLFFGFLLALGLFWWIDFHQHEIVLSLLENACYMLTGIIAMAALVRQSGANLPAFLKVLTWITCGLLIVHFSMAQFIGFSLIVKNPEITRNQWELFKAMVAVTPHDSPLIYHFQIISVGVAFALGLCGLGATLLGSGHKTGLNSPRGVQSGQVSGEHRRS